MKAPQSLPRLGSYSFKGNIGAGAFSVVKLAQQTDTRQYCACKMIPKTVLATSKLGPRFELEIRILQQMHHPNIVALYDLLEDSQNYYVMMEFCPNGDLFQHIIEQRFLKEEDAKKYLFQLISALTYIHRMKVAHRDLKPENLLLDQAFRHCHKICIAHLCSTLQTDQKPKRIQKSYSLLFGQNPKFQRQ